MKPVLLMEKVTNIQKISYVFDSEEEMRLSKIEYFQNIKKQNLVLIGQSPKSKELTFISPSKCDDGQISGQKLKPTMMTSNYSQPGWDFLPKENDLYLTYRTLITGLASFVKKANFWNKDKCNQNFLVESLLNTLSSLNYLGITHGYLSLLSNRNYFLSQVNAIYSKNDLDQIYKKIFLLNDREIIKVQDKPRIDNDFLEVLINLRQRMNETFYINTSALSAPQNFFNSMYKMEYSEFHMKFLKAPILVRNYESKEFYIYRFLMSILFRLLPLLDISLLRRNHILQLCILNIESYFHITWKSQYYESINFYGQR